MGAGSSPSPCPSSEAPVSTTAASSAAAGDERHAAADTGHAGPPAGARRLFWVIGAAGAALVASVHAIESALAGYCPPYDLEARFLAAASGLAGVMVGERLAGGPHRAAIAWTLSACGVGATTVLPFVGFAAHASRTLAIGCGAVAALLLGVSARILTRQLVRPALELGLVAYALNPFRMLLVGVSLMIAAVGFSVLGLLRSGVAAAGLLSLVALGHARSSRYLDRSTPPPTLLGWSAPRAAFVASLVLVFAAERAVRLREIWWYPDPIVYAAEGRQRHIVTRGLAGYELFSDHQLVASSLDRHRYVEALVEVPLSFIEKPPERVLVLGNGAGLVSDRLLAERSLETLMMVTPDAAVLELTESANLSMGRYRHDPRAHIEHDDPLAWLGRHRSTFDLIVAALSAPVDYRRGKYYTTYFFRRIAEHLSPGGVAVVPAASALDYEVAHGCILAAARAAGLHVKRYHAPLPALGEWSFLAVSRVPLRPRRTPSSEGRFITPGMIQQLTRSTPDRKPVATAPCTLFDQRAVRGMVRTLSE